MQASQDFTSAFYALPNGLLDSVMQCAVRALCLQERYSLVAACNFIVRMIFVNGYSPSLIYANEVNTDSSLIAGG